MRPAARSGSGVETRQGERARAANGGEELGARALLQGEGARAMSDVESPPQHLPAFGAVVRSAERGLGVGERSRVLEAGR